MYPGHVGGEKRASIGSQTVDTRPFLSSHAAWIWMTMLALSVDHRVSGELPLSKESSSSRRGRENLNIKVGRPCGLTHYILTLCVCVSTQLFKLHEEMKSIKKKMETLQKSLLRHKGRWVTC